MGSTLFSGRSESCPPALYNNKMGARIFPTKAIAETIEERGKLCFQPTKLIGVHALPSRSPWEAWILASTIGEGNFNLAL